MIPYAGWGTPKKRLTLTPRNASPNQHPEIYFDEEFTGTCPHITPPPDSPAGDNPPEFSCYSFTPLGYRNLHSRT
jgi:hypothetical protein